MRRGSIIDDCVGLILEEAVHQPLIMGRSIVQIQSVDASGYLSPHCAPIQFLFFLASLVPACTILLHIPLLIRPPSTLMPH